MIQKCPRDQALDVHTDAKITSNISCIWRNCWSFPDIRVSVVEGCNNGIRRKVRPRRFAQTTTIVFPCSATLRQTFANTLLALVPLRAAVMKASENSSRKPKVCYLSPQLTPTMTAWTSVRTRGSCRNIRHLFQQLEAPYAIVQPKAAKFRHKINTSR
jgi:hypothetical protein